VAINTLARDDIPFPFNDAFMTGSTGNPVTNVPAVEKDVISQGNLFRHLLMAQAAFGDGRRHLCPVYSLDLKVADKTIVRINLQMISLDNLPMAGGAAKFFAPAEFREMPGVAEADGFIYAVVWKF
jgi:hypothetical protein